MKKEKNLKGKHLVGIRIGKEQDFLVFKTKKEANECVVVLRKKFPKAEIIQTVKAVTEIFKLKNGKK